MYNIMLVSGVRILVLSLWVKLSSTEDFKISHIHLLVLYNNNNESESQSCLILWDLMDCNLPHSSVCGIIKAWIFEWVAISFFRGSSWPRDRIQVCCIAGGFFTIWATREATDHNNNNSKNNTIAIGIQGCHMWERRFCEGIRTPVFCSCVVNNLPCDLSKFLLLSGLASASCLWNGRIGESIEMVHNPGCMIESSGELLQSLMPAPHPRTTASNSLKVRLGHPDFLNVPQGIPMSIQGWESPSCI